jgi:hypothetical protein
MLFSFQNKIYLFYIWDINRMALLFTSTCLKVSMKYSPSSINYKKLNKGILCCESPYRSLNI